MNNEPDGEIKESSAITDQDQDLRYASVMRNQLIMLLDELKKLYRPGMRLTFIARDPDDSKTYTHLTEETNLEEFISALRAMNTLEPITQHKAGQA